MIGMAAAIKTFIKYGLLSIQEKLDITDTVWYLKFSMQKGCLTLFLLTWRIW